MGVEYPKCSKSGLHIHQFVNGRPKSGLLSIKAVRAQTSEPACAPRESLPNQAQLPLIFRTALFHKLYSTVRKLPIAIR